jgi:tryptophanyl-tRNA synthetase
MLYLNFVTVSRLERNPTIKDEIQMRGFDRDIPAGFLCYPVAQAADITAFKATVVPVGDDQAPMIEQTNEIVRRINRQIGRNLLPEARALIPPVGRLPGVDGKSKMSKSLGNTILLSATPDEIRDAVRRMFTDPCHLRACRPGTVEGNVVFTYLDAFAADQTELEALKAHYRRGGLGDTHVKRCLDDILQALLAPIRGRRMALARDPGHVLDVLRQGTMKAQRQTQATLDELRNALGLFRLSG